MEEIANALELKNQLDNLRPIDKEKEAIILQKFRLDWNYHSNHLEGNSLTYGETKALILFGITAQGKPLKDTLEITGHNEAINWVIDLVKGERPLTENFIRELHSLLLKDSYKESKNAEGVLVPRKISAGKYKTTTNHVETVTGEIFYFATPEETPAKMHDLLNWYSEKTKEENINPILVAAEFHYRFIRIHPFDDGNGRTARIVMNFILMQFGFPPVIIKTEDKTNYFAALQMADAGNIEAFVNYIAQNLVRSLEIMIAGAKGESIEEEDDLDKEIALLEQKLSGFGEVEKPKKTKVNILDIINGTVIKTVKSLEKASDKLTSFYFSNILTYEVKNKSDLNYSLNKKVKFKDTIDVNNLDDLIKLISEETMYFNIFYKNKKFKKDDFDYVDFTYQINFLFFENSYSVKPYNHFTLSKDYGTQLTDSEIDKIVKSEVKRHKEFIEQKIAEKENK
ncbi:MAG: Fic family protein [Flavobacteriaceae bacterium]|nr:Fic family protein [Flavobacteriaceae bacterium]